jgi:uncharacterized protein (DUF2252 family)
MKVTKNSQYYVYYRNTGGQYLTESAGNTTGKYRWAKNKNSIALMSYDAAQKARKRYGGFLVRVDTVITEVPV